MPNAWSQVSMDDGLPAVPMTEHHTDDVNYKPEKFIWLIPVEAEKFKLKGLNLMRTSLAVS